MKATAIVVPTGVLLAMGLGVCLSLERHACLKVEAQNDALRLQLNEMAGLTGENGRLSNLLAQANAQHPHPDGAAATNALTDDRLEEITRLRTQVAGLQHQIDDLAEVRADTRATTTALDEAHREQIANRPATHQDSGATNDASFQILQAYYGTERTNLEVSAALNDRIRGGSLKIIAGNKLGGDPDYGQVKNLTVVYRYAGVVLTNQFREGDAVILPSEAPPP